MAAILNVSSVPYKSTFKVSSSLKNSSNRPCIVAKQQGSSITNCPLRRQFENCNGTRRQPRMSLVTKKTTTKCLSVDGLDDTTAGSDPIVSPLIVAASLYEYINAKKLKEVGDLFSKDCILEDCSFPFPFCGAVGDAGFLRSPHVIVRFLMKMYAIVAPVINRLVAGYFKTWTLIARFFTLAIQLLLYVSNKYFPKD